MAGTRPLFLVSNDDGIHAPGIHVLADRLQAFGDVCVVAPHVERSASSQAITLHNPLRVEKLGPASYAVEGNPADCVLFAVRKLYPDRKPDWVVSGINRGSNMGQDTLYSGTIAAAMEGFVNGIRGMAVSLHGHGHNAREDYRVAGAVVEMLFTNPDLLAGTDHGVLNVNVPDCPLDEIRGFSVAKLGRRIYDPEIFEKVDPRGRPYFWLGGGGSKIADIPETDCKLLLENFITLSILQPDHLHAGANQTLAQGGLAGLNALFKQAQSS